MTFGDWILAGVGIAVGFVVAPMVLTLLMAGIAAVIGGIYSVLACIWRAIK